jgi:hypothetical protein
MANKFNEGETLYYFDGADFVKIKIVAAIKYAEKNNHFSILYKIMLPSGEERFHVSADDLHDNIHEAIISERKKVENGFKHYMNLMYSFLDKAYKEAEGKEAQDA